MREKKTFAQRTRTRNTDEVRKKYFLVYEGKETEEIYFEGVNQNRSMIGINPLIELVPVVRSYSEEGWSNPKKIVDRMLLNLKESRLGTVSYETLLNWFMDYLYEEKILVNSKANIKDVIRLYHEKVKIWNLSISITREVIDTKFSDFAIALDSIQDEYNVLICKSAGNCENFTVSRPKGRIHEGADSVRSLVVRSVAHKKGKYDYAEVNDPSPFSRVGPGPEYIIKPEVSHYGGNAGIDPKGRVVTSGVKSFSKEGELAQGVGTSFSTPRITALAAGLV